MEKSFSRNIILCFPPVIFQLFPICITFTGGAPHSAGGIFCAYKQNTRKEYTKIREKRFFTVLDFCIIYTLFLNETTIYFQILPSFVCMKDGFQISGFNYKTYTKMKT